MNLAESDQPLQSGPEALSQTTARLSISMAEPSSDLKVVREMLSESQKGANKTPVFLSPFDDEADESGATAAPAPPAVPHLSAKRRRSSAHSIALVLGKVHKRKSKRTNEPLSLLWSEQLGRAITLNNLRFFMLDVFLAKGLCNTPCFQLSAPWKLKNIVFAFVPELRISDFSVAAVPASLKGPPALWALDKTPGSNESLPFLASLFKYVLPTTLPESMPSPNNVLLLVPLSKNAKKKRAAEMSQVKLVLYDLLLTKQEMQSNKYPIHTLLDPSPENALGDGWVQTREFEHEGSHTFALDCEFCQAESGMVLTRISIVNFQNEVVYDQLVKPDEQIVDYVTKYSGITENMLAGETTTLKDVQEKVLSLVSSSDILIGHSLNSDLEVMKIRHPNIIDTAILFEHHRGYPFKHALKYLAETHLARSIQKGEQDGTGHSSVEDLRACLDLVKLKLIEGPDFGKVLGTSLFRSAYDTNPKFQSSLVDYLMNEYDCLLKDMKEPNLARTVVTNDDEAVDTAIKNLATKPLHLLWLRELQFNCARKNLPPNYSGRIVDEAGKAERKAPTVSTEDRSSLLKALDKRLERLYNELPTDSLLIINTGGGDPTKMNYLNYVKRLFQRQLKAGKDITDFSEEEVWTYNKATELQEATDAARQGMTFMSLKH
ncbi:hypothetical protein METBIDRAFT_11441 [Metschnikowia bicuspidata var. bicuspidata NRRL YB-4993]|uniref:Exonuclease domain-containing protein n=1 Tax=Metschnikowia bicuspidata var. bicuspidata NRRL YB-4993 TaxID=869754 RepID=A0A1A0HFI8_9ASCO|nr:hypothetical protein METBIDRAFT_11441 [Metschnikowia bicuspidata var. bicuspidata NRRL YB-4993]OBA22628.1 hypothetical protein METBIDRAFT_11441 [Metschnikowia bicuspidata var. bicuspidata NRRL YB-4993]